MPSFCTLFRVNWAWQARDNEVKLMMKYAPEYVQTSNPVIRSPVHYLWNTTPACTGATIKVTCNIVDCRLTNQELLNIWSLSQALNVRLNYMYFEANFLKIGVSFKKISAYIAVNRDCHCPYKYTIWQNLKSIVIFCLIAHNLQDRCSSRHKDPLM